MTILSSCDHMHHISLTDDASVFIIARRKSSCVDSTSREDLGLICCLSSYYQKCVELGNRSNSQLSA